MNIAIIDDEQIWINRIADSLKEYLSDDVNIITYTDWRAFDYKADDFDVVFFDVELDDSDTSTGLSLCRSYKEYHPDEQHIAIILTTHQEFASKGYISHAFRYINKHNLEEELKEALDSAYEIVKKPEIISFDSEKYGLIEIPTNSIVLIETSMRKLIIRLKNHDTLVLKEKYQDVCAKLASFDFYSIRKGVLVNMLYISNIEHYKVIIRYINEDYYLSRRNLKGFKEAYYKYRKKRL